MANVITPDDTGKVTVSDNGHYAVYVREREERDYPGHPIPRYEIVNLQTLAVEARVSSFHMALFLMDQFDGRLERFVTTGAIYDEDFAEPEAGVTVN